MKNETNLCLGEVTNTAERTDERARLDALIHYLRSQFERGGMAKEHVHAIFLDAQRRYLADQPLGSGGLARVSFRMRTVFELAMASGTRSLIIAHNHPSGECRPSRADWTATRKIAMIAKVLDMELLDHLIITSDRAYSMRAGGAF